MKNGLFVSAGLKLRLCPAAAASHGMTKMTNDYLRADSWRGEARDIDAELTRARSR